MALVRYYNPFKELEDQFSDLVQQVFLDKRQPSLSTPVTDIYTEDEGANQKLVVEAHLPNFSKDEVTIEAHKGALELRAEHQEKKADTSRRKYMIRESSSSFYRRVGLPKNVDADKVKANFQDGVLRVTIPFKELPKPKQIAIEDNKRQSK